MTTPLPPMTGRLTIRVHVAWWLKWLYLPAIMLMARLGIPPDMQKVAIAMHRGVRIVCRVVPAGKLAA